MWGLTLPCVVIFLSSVSYVHPKHTAHEKSWDILIFTQHWPPTICKLWMEKKPHTCAMPTNQDTWTIHGIWPTKIGTMGPFFCNKTWLFDPEEVKPIESQLEQSWTNIEADTSLYSFWAHEWNKHGTCAAEINTFNSQIKYFTEGLNLLKNYTMDSILEAEGIIPSDTKEYSVTDFYKAIRSKLGIEPEIECRNDEGKQYIFELRICFTKSMELTDCRTNSLTYVSNCDASKGILYPESVTRKSKLIVELYKLGIWLQWLTL